MLDLLWGCRFVCLFIRLPFFFFSSPPFSLEASVSVGGEKKNAEISGERTDGRKKTQGQM